MRIEEATFKVELDKEEINMIAYSLYHSLITSIETHYNSLQQNKDGEAIFHEQEAKELYLMQEMFSMIGYRNLSESYMKEFARMFEKRRKEREAKSEE